MQQAENPRRRHAPGRGDAASTADDVDLDAGTLVIADSKFGKSRQVFLHPSTITVLRAYAKARDEALPEPGTAAFFVNSLGGR